MKAAVLGLALVAGMVAGAAFASDDPIESRKALMRANGAAAGAASGLMKGEIAFDARIGGAAIAAWRATATNVGDYFPEGSTGENTRALPAIWDDADGFAAALAKFRADVEAAAAANPQDQESFAAVAGTVLGNCGACHSVYRQ